MKIGILTFHRAHNYGAVLQCYALQEIIKGMGHDVEIIDFRQPHIEKYYKKHIRYRYFLRYCLRFEIRSLHNYLKEKRCEFNEIIAFALFRYRRLNCSKKILGNEIKCDYDRYVIGSDQVWGLHCCGGFEPVYFGYFNRKEGSKLYGYAISSNGDFFDFFSRKKLIEVVNKFDAISFRERSICKQMEKETCINFRLSLDPTLLTDKKIWNPLIKNRWRKRKYVALYHIRGSRNNPGLIEKNVYDFAKKHGFEFVNLSTMTYSVEDFVSALKYAQCVFTSSFHATVFSLVFCTPFYSFILNDGHDERYVDLLNILGLSDHILEENCSISYPLRPETKVFGEKLIQLKKMSLDYLDMILSE